MDDIWNAKRIRLEHMVIEATLNLFEHMGMAGAFKLQIEHTNPKVYIIAGDVDALKSMTDTGKTND